MDNYIINNLGRSHGKPVIEGQLLIAAAAPPLGPRLYDLKRLRFYFQHGLISGHPLRYYFFQAGKIELLQLQLQRLGIPLTGCNQFMQRELLPQIQKAALLLIFLRLWYLPGRGLFAELLHNPSAVPLYCT
ncbi:hypothetical protein D3C80_1525320 [compost metagenome]